ncbi:hypothetical protein AgCh_005453 [Apium graveolens]
MNHRFIFEAVDRTFRDIRNKTSPNARLLPFGGVTMLLGGDFRQTLPVLPKKGREDVVASTITKRVQFRDWILALGDGSEPTLQFGDDIEPSWIKIPNELRLNYNGDPMDAMVAEVYGDLRQRHGDIEYLRDRAILTPLNDGVPNHEIQVKIDSPIMLLRNLNPKKGLCNGTRLIVRRTYPFIIEALIITGNRIGDITYIPRINMSPADKTLPFMLKRKQFPIAVCYAMTINKSQGQPMKNVGLFLPKIVFSHGHFYVAVSRVTSPRGLKIVYVDEAEEYLGGLWLGRECFACAPTASGKAMAFVYPMLIKLKRLNPHVLVLVQNKERAKELYNELKNEAPFRLLACPVKLLFHESTSLEPLEDSVVQIPRHVVEFVKESILRSRANNSTILLDIVDCYLGSTDVETIFGDNKRRHVNILTDFSVTIIVTLWGNIAEVFDPSLYTEEDAPHVIVVTSVLVNAFKDMSSDPPKHIEM